MSFDGVTILLPIRPEPHVIQLQLGYPESPELFKGYIGSDTVNIVPKGEANGHSNSSQSSSNSNNGKANGKNK